LSRLPLSQLDFDCLTGDQQASINAPVSGSLLLSGPAGSGKTTVGAFRLQHLVSSGIPGDSILILVPQRSLAEPYARIINAPDFPPGSPPLILTFNGLAQRMISLFWPLVSSSSGFKHPNHHFQFLTIETAQYYMATLTEPLLQQGFFESLTIDPNRLYSQILDNLNKSAMIGFPPDEIAERLSNAWSGKATQTQIYNQAQECALRFRTYCLEHNLLDFSLQLEIFTHHLWPSLLCRSYLKQTFRHLIYDNIEEDYPVVHDCIAEWISDLQSVLLIQDSQGGFRTFLGADPESASKLGTLCDTNHHLSGSFIKSPAIDNLEPALTSSIRTHKSPEVNPQEIAGSYHVSTYRFYPEMLDGVTDKISTLIRQENVPPDEIAILTPFLSDALRFSIANRLDSAGIPFTTYRPSRSLKTEPAVRTILTLIQLAHPSWGNLPSRQDVRAAFSHAIQSCDYARADLIAQVLYRPTQDQWSLNSFDTCNLEMQERISFRVGELYDRLRQWLFDNRESADNSLDHWISRLYGECLSQSGFGFHENFDDAALAAQLIESSKKFRNNYTPQETSGVMIAKEYIRVLKEGILAAQSFTSTIQKDAADAVFLGPAYSFLMRNKPVSFQFWLDIGSQGWWSRLEQPLTQPYVLNRNWSNGKKWTDQDEYTQNQENLARLISGLLRRCRLHLEMCSVSLNERGIEERGQLLLALQMLQRELSRQAGAGNV